MDDDHIVSSKKGAPFSSSSKEHGKSCIGIFYEKYCVSNIPWHGQVQTHCVKWI